MYSRPTAQETDTDLLRMQAEFLNQKSENTIKLAATVVSERKNEDHDGSQETTTIDIQEQIANTFEAIPVQNVGQIVEKRADLHKTPQLSFNQSRGFPSAKRRDLSINNGSSKSSIFAQQMKKLRPNTELMEIESIPSTSSSIIIKEQREPGSRTVNVPEQSYVLTGPEKADIHNENINKLKSMTETEILEERERLISSMDPALISFLKSRHQRGNTENRNLTIKQQNEAAQNVGIDEIETPKDILNQPNSDQWLNFNLVEANKLAWMQNIEIKKIDKQAAYEARFDFQGWLLAYSEGEINEKSRILYHHGEEPDRPGYTLQELFQLSRSNVMQQKIIALNTIANLLSLQSTGVYDEIIDLPIEQIFFVLRFCLDDNSPNVLNASIKALRNLFHCKIDETCLDCLLGFGLGQFQPILAIDHDTEDDDQVNDQQLAETNLVKCLSRTEILVRFRYIINTVKPSNETIIYCMDILTRLIRDSEFIFLKVYNCENLIKSILEHFVPKNANPFIRNVVYGLPLLEALKFVRILASRSKGVAQELIEKYNIMDSILCYLSSESYSLNAYGLKLQTESLHLWSTLLHYKLAENYLQIASPIMLQLLNYHLKNTDLKVETTFVRQAHVAALLNLIGVYSKNCLLGAPYFTTIEQCFFKWTRQFMKLAECSCGKLQIISSLFFCFTSLCKSKQVPETSLFQIKDVILQLLSSEAFEIITKTIKNGSMLLNNYETHKSSSNLKTLECAAWDTSEHTIPLVQTNSPLPFLCSLSEFIETVESSAIKLNFIQHMNVGQYLQLLREHDRYFLTNHWFTRIEAALIMHILKISVSIKSELSDTGLFYELAVKCLSIFNSEHKRDMDFILNNIVFNCKFYPSDVLLQNLDLGQRSDSLEVSLNNLDEILCVYIKILGLQDNVSDFEDTLSIDLCTGNVIPIDWIYTPIIVMYSNQQQNKQSLSESEQIFIIRNCLRWIMIYETYFPKLAASINPTDRFCRIACVFLGSDSLFLVEEIHKLLELCLKNVITKCEENINFSKDIEGLNSFQDFYTQLLEQYQGVSYGDVLFGNFILVPLAQRHSVKWRKTLWSEYMGVVDIFNVTPAQCVCSVDSLLTPLEEDVSLLKCYRRALINNSIRKHSILSTVAKHHVEEFVKRKNLSKEQ